LTCQDFSYFYFKIHATWAFIVKYVPSDFYFENWSPTNQHYVNTVLER